MTFAGLQKISLVDYPGCIAAIVFTQGCNFACPYCYNRDLIPMTSEHYAEENKILDYLEKRKKMIEGLVVTGGEPSLQQDLRSFIFKVKDLGYKVKLDTNGGDPVKIKELVNLKEIDYVALDIKTSLKKYSLVTKEESIADKMKELISFLISSNIDYEFRTTCVPGIVEKEDFIDIALEVKGAKKYYLQQFTPINTLCPEYSNQKPYQKEELKEFKEILSSSVQNVSIRGIKA